MVRWWHRERPLQGEVADVPGGRRRSCHQLRLQGTPTLWTARERRLRPRGRPKKVPAPGEPPVLACSQHFCLLVGRPFLNCFRPGAPFVTSRPWAPGPREISVAAQLSALTGVLPFSWAPVWPWGPRQHLPIFENCRSQSTSTLDPCAREPPT